MGFIIFGFIFFILSLIFSLDDDTSNILIWFMCFWGSVLIVAGIFSKTPTAMDLHAGKAVIKYEIVDGVKVDSTFVFRD